MDMCLSLVISGGRELSARGMSVKLACWYSHKIQLTHGTFPPLFIITCSMYGCLFVYMWSAVLWVSASEKVCVNVETWQRCFSPHSIVQRCSGHVITVGSSPLEECAHPFVRPFSRPPRHVCFPPWSIRWGAWVGRCGWAWEGVWVME